MNTAIYARKMPFVPQSIRTQLKLCKAVAKEKGLMVPKYNTYVDENPIIDGVKCFNSLIRHCGPAGITSVIVEDVSILTGSIFQLHHLLQELGDYGVRFISVNQGIDLKACELRVLYKEWLNFIATSEKAKKIFLNSTLNEELAFLLTLDQNVVPNISMKLWRRVAQFQKALYLGNLHFRPIYF